MASRASAGTGATARMAAPTPAGTADVRSFELPGARRAGMTNYIRIARA